ncbi:MAG: DEAD/DEAH box helicase [Burkholderiales bacterium]
MRTTTLPVPGLLLGAYPERRAPEPDVLARFAGQAGAALAPLLGLRDGRYASFLARVGALESQFQGFSPEEFAERLHDARVTMSRYGLIEPLMVEAFALIRRSCLQELGVRPYDTQLIAARIMLDNRLAEMATGEGKTLAAAICAATAALAGIPVHVITANDYLVARDAESLRPLYAALGLSVGCVTQPLEFHRRQQAYGCDITYCTGKELVFDYLRDRIVRNREGSDLAIRAAQLNCASTASRPTLLRGLCMAIVDEADSILIDEARVPLILSELRSNPGQHEYHRHALRLALQLTVDQDFCLDPHRMSAELMPNGRNRVDHWARELGSIWQNRLHREETFCMALAATHLFHRDRHYLVRDGTVGIIDETTGRLAAGRVWSRGLHQLIEAKEDCQPSGEQVPVAQITYQRFFQRYFRLGGMSGTLREARGELQSIYRLRVTRVPLLRPRRRKTLATQLFPNRAALWRSVVDRAVDISRSGRPVLIGTDSVADSESLSRELGHAGVEHAVLNARHDRKEAQIIAKAGQPGCITVATNMAGRGTDIPLGAGVAERGGLHVINCQHNTSRRIDRQLLGRCARQGDPGSTETLLSLDKPLISRLLPQWIVRLVGDDGLLRPQLLIRLLICVPQLVEEDHQRAQRADLLKHDLRADRELSLGGRFE